MQVEVKAKSHYLCSGTILGNGSSFKAARMLSRTMRAILFLLSQVLKGELDSQLREEGTYSVPI